ncbi:alpha/beta hydrolase [candidate division WWE3 bacterium]|uniref:Alpha/beta hydrolase n=1 Tax=candidate division WWE3 bacterium TaxID=2053526 RepID=A0A7X9HSW7_UNCKA|nr:alpha/beta hydrolase [candidate division WWE3 bacterium]
MIVDIKGVKVSYSRTCSSKTPKGTLVFLHGWGGSSQSWKPNISELKQNYDCIAIDMPGFSVSAQPDEIWGVEEYSKFIKDFAVSLNLNRFVLVGKSFGGRIGILYASKWSETLTHLILVAAAGLERRSLLDKIKVALAKIGKLPLSLLGFKNFELLREHFYKVIGVNRDSNNYKWEVKKLVTNTNLTEAAEKIPVPTLIVWGTNDVILPLKVGKELNHKIKGSILKQIKGGHNAHQESAEEFNYLVDKFLANNRGLVR